MDHSETRSSHYTVRACFRTPLVRTSKLTGLEKNSNIKTSQRWTMRTLHLFIVSLGPSTQPNQVLCANNLGRALSRSTTRFRAATDSLDRSHLPPLIKQLPGLGPLPQKVDLDGSSWLVAKARGTLTSSRAISPFPPILTVSYRRRNLVLMKANRLIS